METEKEMSLVQYNGRGSNKYEPVRLDVIFEDIKRFFSTAEIGDVLNIKFEKHDPEGLKALIAA